MKDFSALTGIAAMASVHHLIPMVLLVLLQLLMIEKLFDSRRGYEGADQKKERSTRSETWRNFLRVSPSFEPKQSKAESFTTCTCIG